jgi:hypothetical protein
MVMVLMTLSFLVFDIESLEMVMIECYDGLVFVNESEHD